MIEKVHVKGQKGILPIVLLIWIPFLNLISFFMAINFVKKSEQLRYVPECLIIGRFSILRANFWAYVSFLWCLLLVAVAMSPAGAEMAVYYWGSAFIALVVGYCLINTFKRHKLYLANVDKLLSHVYYQPKVTKSELITMFSGKTRYDYANIQQWLQDLSLNDVVRYREETGTDNLYIEIVAPEIAPIKPVAKDSEKTLEKFVWVCSSCGAENQASVSFQEALCEYCGAPAK